MVDKLPLSASIPFESTDEEDHHQYQKLFNDHPEGKGILISPLSWWWDWQRGTAMDWIKVWVKSSDQPALQSSVPEGDGASGSERECTGWCEGSFVLEAGFANKAHQNFELLVRDGVVRVTLLWLPVGFHPYLLRCCEADHTAHDQRCHRHGGCHRGGGSSEAKVPDLSPDYFEDVWHV